MRPRRQNQHLPIYSLPTDEKVKAKILGVEREIKKTHKDGRCTYMVDSRDTVIGAVIQDVKGVMSVLHFDQTVEQMEEHIKKKIKGNNHFQVFSE